MHARRSNRSWLATILAAARGPLRRPRFRAATFIPMRDREIFARADVVVHGIVDVERRRRRGALARDGHGHPALARSEGTTAGLARSPPGRRPAFRRVHLPPSRPARVHGRRRGRGFRHRAGRRRLPDGRDGARQVRAWSATRAGVLYAVPGSRARGLADNVVLPRAGPGDRRAAPRLREVAIGPLCPAPVRRPGRARLHRSRRAR